MEGLEQTVKLKRLHDQTISSPSQTSNNKFSNSEANARYQLGAVLGKGGNATVVEAHDKDLQRTVAVKLLKSRFHDDERAVQRFVNEARITSKLQHPGVIPVHDIGFLGEGNYFFAMKKVQGKTLRDLLAEEKELPLSEAINHFRALAQTMAFAHDSEIAHRDLKPENIMVEDYGSTLIVDWGIAKDFSNPDYDDPFKDLDEKVHTDPDEKELEKNLTQVGEITGTPAYMSPEQCKGMMKKMDARSDIFSLGTILYEIIAGDNPFVPSKSADYRAIFHRISNIDISAPSRDRQKRRVPIELQAICMKCLNKCPDDRYQTAGELLNDLVAFLSDRPVKAHSTSIQTSISKWAVRNMRYIIVVGLLFISALTFIVLQSNADRQFSNYIKKSFTAVQEKQQVIKTTEERLNQQSSEARLVAQKRLPILKSDLQSQWQATKSSLLYVASNRKITLQPATLLKIKILWFKEIDQFLQIGKLPEANSSLLSFEKLVDLKVFQISALEKSKVQHFHRLLGR